MALSGNGQRVSDVTAFGAAVPAAADKGEVGFGAVADCKTIKSWRRSIYHTLATWQCSMTRIA